MENPFKRSGQALVSKVNSEERHLKDDVLRAVDLVGGFGKIIKKGDEILLKPNFNSGDAPPGSTDPDFVDAIITSLYEHGAGRVIVGESSMMSLSTRKVFEETGMMHKADNV